MTNSVRRLDDASHTVKLAAGATFDGIKKGNMLTPAVAMMPKMPSALAINAKLGRRAEVKSKAEIGPRKPRIGAVIIQEWAR